MKGIVSKKEDIKSGEFKDGGKWKLTIATIGNLKYATFEGESFKIDDLIEFTEVDKDGKLSMQKGSIEILEKGIGPEPEQIKVGDTIKVYPKDPVGLAVEVFVSLVDDIKHGQADTEVVMKTAIERVKQAQDAFK